MGKLFERGECSCSDHQLPSVREPKRWPGNSSNQNDKAANCERQSRISSPVERPLSPLVVTAPQGCWVVPSGDNRGGETSRWKESAAPRDPEKHCLKSVETSGRAVSSLLTSARRTAISKIPNKRVPDSKDTTSELELERAGSPRGRPLPRSTSPPEGKPLLRFQSQPFDHLVCRLRAARSDSHFG